ncbi:MAG: tripeptide aminopeptidase PepT, partial [Lachnospiraceae bacterium]|nr:tripeptide aminopeptidase PepT [Lachnospiraceae bacterium]
MNDNQKKILDRFIRYISVWTTSKDDMENIPSTERQFDLSNMLGKELEKMGLQDVKVTDHSYVYATFPATKGMQDKKTTGFISHVDTATEFSGENVKPIIHENYDGADILLTGSGKMLTTKAFSDLLTLKGKTLITTDGTTLLGADDKAGITEIMTMLEYLTNHPEEEHGELKICFTPDEEVGRGPDMFDVEGFGADYAYTVDGDYEGDVAYENFNACSAEIEIEGVNVH